MAKTGRTKSRKKKNLSDNNQGKILELIKKKPRKEQEKFFLEFSNIQLNAVLLLTLAATFLIQGIPRYLETTGKEGYLKAWLIIMICGLIFLVISVGTITTNKIISSLKLQRIMNIVGFMGFMTGFMFFLAALISLFIILAM